MTEVRKLSISFEKKERKMRKMRMMKNEEWKREKITDPVETCMIEKARE